VCPAHEQQRDEQQRARGRPHPSLAAVRRFAAAAGPARRRHNGGGGARVPLDVIQQLRDALFTGRDSYIAPGVAVCLGNAQARKRHITERHITDKSAPFVGLCTVPFVAVAVAVAPDGKE
jgi:hypothetical protein